MRSLCAVVFCAMSLASCSRTTPTSPTPPVSDTPPSNLPPVSSVIGISVIGDMWISTTSAPVQHTARLITSNTPFEWTDGSDGVQWSIAPAGIATIDKHGRITPLNVGAAIVTAVYGDKTGVNPVRVLPDVSGNWTGEYIITACDGGGNDPRECGRMMFGPPDTNGLTTYQRYVITLALTQFRDQVTGTLREPRASGDITTPVTGIVRQNGTLVLEANDPRPNNQTFRILNWSSTPNFTVSSMSGAFTQIEPRTSAISTPYAIRTEQEFANIAHAQ